MLDPSFQGVNQFFLLAYNKATGNQQIVMNSHRR